MRVRVVGVLDIRCLPVYYCYQKLSLSPKQCKWDIILPPANERLGNQSNPSRIQVVPDHELTLLIPPCAHSVRRIHDLAPAQPSPWRSSNALPRRLLEALLSYHVDLIGQRDNDVLITAVFEVVGFDFLLVPLDRVWVFPPGEDTLQVPRNNKRPCSRDDRRLLLVLASIEARWGESQRQLRLMAELRDVLRRETQASGLRLVVFGEGDLESGLPLVLAILLQSINEHKIRRASSKDPATVSRDVKTDDCFSECGHGGFGADSKAVEHADFALLGGDSQVPCLGCGDIGESGLGGILFKVGVDELVTRETGVDAVESVVGETDKGLLARHLGKFLNGISMLEGDKGKRCLPSLVQMT